MLLPNPRGSTGYGSRFEDLNNADWGHGDLQDVIHGAEVMKKLDDVNPEKMGVTGVSYGGIMGMAAVSFAPGYFQASIPMSGYDDFVHMKAEQELRHVKLLENEFGTLEEHEDVYRKCSAIFNVDKVTTPPSCFTARASTLSPSQARSSPSCLSGSTRPSSTRPTRGRRTTWRPRRMSAKC